MKGERFEALRSAGVLTVKKMELDAMTPSQLKIMFLDLVATVNAERQQSESEITMLSEIVARRKP